MGNDILSEISQPFRPRARVLQLLGDELIGSARLAVFELVKNAYAWKPASQSARSHRGSEAVGFHTSHNPDGGFTYEPLTRGWVLLLDRGGFFLRCQSERKKAPSNDTGHA